MALIIGGNRGIGKAIGLAFAEAQARVVIAARNVSLLEHVVEEMREHGGAGFYVAYDLAKDEDLFKLIQTVSAKYSKIDILVNNSGISPFVKKSE